MRRLFFAKKRSVTAKATDLDLLLKIEICVIRWKFISTAIHIGVGNVLSYDKAYLRDYPDKEVYYPLCSIGTSRVYKLAQRFTVHVDKAHSVLFC